MQIYDVNTGNYAPDWTSAAGKLIITPVVYANQTAIVFSLYAPQGTVFMNGSGTLLLQTSAYDGSSPITSGATYEWAKYSGGSWQTISGETASSLSVDGVDVAGQARLCRHNDLPM